MTPADRRQAEPFVHVFLEDRRGRRRQIRVHEGAAGNPAPERVAVAFPVQAAAAIWAESEPDVGAAIGPALKDLVFALDPYLGLQPGGAKMEGGAGAALTCLAVTEINPLRLARGDDL